MNRLAIETSQQTIPGLELDGHQPLGPAASRPLHELQQQAPTVIDESAGSWPYVVGFPYANDESASYIQQVAARTGTPDYQTATNRTALLIGEGSLISALPYMPEDTIIILDKNPRFCAYMQHYVDSLRSAPNIRGWHSEMARRLKPGYDGNSNDPAVYKEQFMGLNLDMQIRQWHSAGLQHGLDDETSYTLARELANKKAIVVWQADLKDETDMQRLGQALRENQATITMANLSNVVSWHKPGGTAVSQRLALEELPITEYAPILTTSLSALPTGFNDHGRKSYGKKPEDPIYLLPATGPFFGLRNLFEQGGTGPIADSVERQANAVFRRQYLTPPDSK